jgi:hypothetical protein
MPPKKMRGGDLLANIAKQRQDNFDLMENDPRAFIADQRMQNIRDSTIRRAQEEAYAAYRKAHPVSSLFSDLANGVGGVVGMGKKKSKPKKKSTTSSAKAKPSNKAKPKRKSKPKTKSGK